MFVFLFLALLVLTAVAALVLGPRMAKPSSGERGAGPSSLKMDVMNETTYTIANLEPGRARSMTAAEATTYLEKLRREGKILPYRDYYLLRERMERAAR